MWQEIKKKERADGISRGLRDYSSITEFFSRRPGRQSLYSYGGILSGGMIR